MANALHLAGLLDSTFTADDFSTVNVTSLTVPGSVVATPVSPMTWLDGTGEPWLSGGDSPALSYTISAVSDADQVVTFQIAGGTPPQSTTVYGQLMNWNQSALLFKGFLSFDPATGALSNPLPGASQSFVLSSLSLEASHGLPQPSSFQTSGAVPFFLSEFNNTACFAHGTAIMTPTGPQPVEDLAEGDSILTASGQVQPIRWIGRSQFRCSRHANPGRVSPVRIQQHAFGASLPARDLVLSPEHAIYHDGVLIPVHCLVNGTTIQQIAVESVSYYHVELPRHDVLLAEGLPAESYLDTGSRNLMTPAHMKTHAA